MPSPFPHHYEVNLQWTGEKKARLEAPSKLPILGGPPPEFDGDAMNWSPEHLLLSALNLCLMNTFMAIATKARLITKGYKSQAKGTLEKKEKGIVFTSLELIVNINVEENDIASAEKCLGTAKKYCIISNALNVPVNVTSHIGKKY